MLMKNFKSSMNINIKKIFNDDKIYKFHDIFDIKLA